MNSYSKYGVFLLIIFGIYNNSFAQKIFQIEQFGSTDVVRFFIGNELTFKLKDSNQWYTRTIEDIVADKNLVLFTETGFVDIREIVAIQKSAKKLKSKRIAYTFYTFGLQWGFWSVASTLVGEELTWTALIVPAIAFSVGYLIRILGKSKVWKIGKRRRVRVLDLSFL